MRGLRIAVIGSGIAGLSAAWLLSRKHRVTLYEAEGRPGGHANTVDVDTGDGRVAVDTGFIVFNRRSYPNLDALFDHLGVQTDETEMSFAYSQDGGRYEYSGSGVAGFFGQPRNFLAPDHWRLLRDISRFFATCSERLKSHSFDISLADFLAAENYSSSFVDRHIVPMGAAIWSTAPEKMLRFPARSFVRFYETHDMLKFTNRPLWRTVSGGSRNYVARLLDDSDMEVLTGVAVKRLFRHESYVHVEDRRGVSRPFDHAVLACHGDQALRLLDAPHPKESEVLSRFTYQDNRAVLHRDGRWMPHRKGLWSSWNYRRDPQRPSSLCVTYWMNRLQKLPTSANLFVTLNPTAPIHPKMVAAELRYRHPVFDAAALAAQRHLWRLQGKNRTWYCGSYFGYGFHEDGIQSGLAVAEQLGGIRRPWRVDGESNRIFLVEEGAMEAAE